MKVQPKSEQEIAELNLWPAGEYGFEVLEYAKLGEKTVTTQETVSKLKPDGTGGNDMIVLVVQVFNNEGKSRITLDYLMPSDDRMAYKIRHASEACGLLSNYESGAISAEDFIGKTGFLKLKIQPAKGDYQAKNSIADYLANASDAPPVKQSKPAVKSATDDLEDEIPF